MDISSSDYNNPPCMMERVNHFTDQNVCYTAPSKHRAASGTECAAGENFKNIQLWKQPLRNWSEPGFETGAVGVILAIYNKVH